MTEPHEVTALDLVQQVMRLQLTLASAGATGAELGRYVLDHRAAMLPA